MLTHLKRLIFLLLVAVMPFFVYADPSNESMINTNATSAINLAPFQALLGGNASNPACTDIANQIATVSAMKTADKVYPWEDLDWLKKSLGEPKLAQTSDEKSFYAWICLNPTGTSNMVLYITMDKAGVKRVMIESMICKATESCKGYGFERQGNKINGFSLQSSSLFQN